MTSHNSLFGWIHGFKINHNNLLLGSPANRLNPYPALIPQPTARQCLQNWNAADTGVVLFTLAASSIVFARLARNSGVHGYFAQRQQFYFLMTVSTIGGLALGLRNSYYRLAGLVPNGLPANEILQPVKYDYTSSFLRNSFLSSFFEKNKKPTQ